MGDWKKANTEGCHVREVGHLVLRVAELKGPKFLTWVNGVGPVSQITLAGGKEFFPSLDAAKRWAEDEVRRICNEALEALEEDWRHKADVCRWCIRCIRWSGSATGGESVCRVNTQRMMYDQTCPRWKPCLRA